MRKRLDWDTVEKKYMAYLSKMPERQLLLGSNCRAGSAGHRCKAGQNLARTPNTILRPGSGAMSFSSEVDMRMSSFSRFFASTK